MLRTFERIGDRLLNRVVPRATASAENCYRGKSYCVHPSNACGCPTCLMECWVCAGYTTCSFRGVCCK